MIFSKVAIIVVNWNGIKDTLECLNSLNHITYPNYDVIIVDNGSSGSDCSILRQITGQNIYLIENGLNYGFAEGNNIGMRWALSHGSAYLLLLNNDTVVHPDFLSELVKVGELRKRAGVLGPKIYRYGSKNRLQFAWHEIDMRFGIIRNVGRNKLDSGQYDQITRVDAVQGSCFLIKREVVEEVGFLDDGFFSGWEDIDYCVESSTKGYEIIYVPASMIWHKGSVSFRRVPGRWGYYTARNHFLFMRKHASRQQYFTFLAYFFGFYLWFCTGLYLVYHRSIAGAIGYWRGVFDGMMNR